jgi:hypothetical protein
MFVEVDEAEFRANPDAMLDRVQSGCEAIVVKAEGRIVVALVNPHLFDGIRRMDEHSKEIAARIAEDFRDVRQR